MTIDQFNARAERIRILLKLFNTTVPQTDGLPAVRYAKREGQRIMIEGLKDMLAAGKIFEESNRIPQELNKLKNNMKELRHILKQELAKLPVIIPAISIKILPELKIFLERHTN